MNIVEVQKSPTWVDHISAIEVGGSLSAFEEQAPYLRHVISGKMKYQYPNRRFKTETVTREGIDYIVIHRLEDRELNDKEA